ncbi:MAG: helix-turn-helix domain-containing protein [Defluviitaleaceae bacterium]|nr:helix-turn-helix domain-containing protein [Defluviitaleaceae bacterium]
MHSLGERLAHARQHRSFSQLSLADDIGVSRGVISNIENGRAEPQIIVVNAVCQTLNINKDWLLDGVGAMENKAKASKSARVLTELYETTKDFSEDELLYLNEIVTTIPDIAKAIGLSDSTVRGIIAGKSKSVALDIASSLSQGHDVDLEMLITSAEQRHIKKFRALDTHGKKTVNLVLNSEYERIQLQLAMREEQQQEPPEVREMKVYWESSAAGLGNYLSDCDSNYDMVTFLTEEVPSDADFGIRISGDSMEPSIYGGAIAWVEATPEISSGEVGIFVLNGESYCKELKIVSNKTTGKVVSLISHNDKYGPISFREGDVLKTVGRVLSTS